MPSSHHLIQEPGQDQPQVTQTRKAAAGGGKVGLGRPEGAGGPGKQGAAGLTEAGDSLLICPEGLAGAGVGRIVARCSQHGVTGQQDTPEGLCLRKQRTRPLLLPQRLTGLSSPNPEQYSSGPRELCEPGFLRTLQGPRGTVFQSLGIHEEGGSKVDVTAAGPKLGLPDCRFRPLNPGLQP